MSSLVDFVQYIVSVCTNKQYPCALEREFLTSRQWGSLFTDDILAVRDSDDRQYMNTLWGLVIQKYADISIPHLEHVTGKYCPHSLILPLLSYRSNSEHCVEYFLFWVLLETSCVGRKSRRGSSFGLACWHACTTLHPAYLSESLQLVHDVDVDAQGHLHSTDSMTLVVPATRCSTLGDRAFPVSAARTWNALLSELHCHSLHFDRSWKYTSSTEPIIWTAYLVNSIKPCQQIWQWTNRFKFLFSVIFFFLFLVIC